jgi:hypothetical protein
MRRKGYVRLLEERVARLEQQAREKGLIDNAGQSSGSTLAPPGSASPSTPAAAGADEMGLNNLALYAMAEPGRRQDEFLRELSMPRIISVVTETYGGNPEATERVHPLWDAVAKFVRTGDQPRGTNGVPVQRIYFPHEVASQALETYCRVVDYRYPRLAVWKAKQGLEALTSDDNALHQAMLLAHPAHLFQAYMVIAIVPLVSDLYPVSQGSFISAHILSTSLKVLDAVFQKEDGVDIVQCLHLLVIFSMHSSAAGSSWHLIGFGMKKCLALGYHKEPAIISEDADERRWAFWACYLLDRLISAALDRPFAINDSDISVQLPQDAGNPKDVQYLHLFRYAMLLSDVIADGCRSPMTIQLSALLHWRSLNPHTDESATSPSQAYLASLDNTLMLRLVIDHILVSTQVATSTEQQHTPDIGHGADHLPSFLNVPQVCQAVVNSLSRPDMKQRSFLSWLTGYSAFSVYLVILYWAPRWTGETPIDTLLQPVKEILDLVGNQFSRLKEYARVAQLLRGGETVSEMDVSSGIGPRHLQMLGWLIVRNAAQ